MVETPEKKSVEDYLDEISYAADPGYVPSEFALELVNFIKLVNGAEGEEHATPVIHYRMLDQVIYGGTNVANMCARGTAKTTLLGEYLILYLAVHGELPEFGKINLGLYVSDSVENGVKNMRKNLEYRWTNSEFLQKYVPDARFTDVRWEFTNVAGQVLIVKGYGAKTGVRGTKEQGVRPQLAILDDLVSDDDARSPTVIGNIEDTVQKAIRYALHPSKYKIIWSGTPFNAGDPLYKAVESGAWAVNLYPICEQFPCDKKDFRGAWEDRFTYEYVAKMYDDARKEGRIDTFNQELMLRIMSDEERLIRDEDIVWYDRDRVLTNRSAYNFYITTDLATSERDAADFSVISVWAYSNNGDWLYVDGICKKQTVDKSIDDLFTLAQKYNPQQVGIEVSGQQGGFIPWIQNEMMDRNVWFNLASDKNSNQPGIRPSVKKFERFLVMVPQIKAHKVWFPKQLEDTPMMKEAMNELTLASQTKFKSKNDDFVDTISMLASLKAWKPSQVTPEPDKDDKYWDQWEDPKEIRPRDLYIV